MYVNERYGFTNVWDMLCAMEDDFIAGGMDIVTSAKNKYLSGTYQPGTDLVLVVKPTQKTDILYLEAPWVMVFVARPTNFRYDLSNYNAPQMYSGLTFGGSLFTYVTTPTQLLDPDAGRVAFDHEFPGFASGSLGAQFTGRNWKRSQSTNPIDPDDPAEIDVYYQYTLPFIEWFLSIEAEGIAHTSKHSRYPYHPHASAATGSYFMSITNHGVFFKFWKEAKDHQGNSGVWFCVQRAVNRSGNVLDVETKPLYCVFKYATSLRFKGDVSTQYNTYVEVIRNPQSTTDQIGAAWESINKILGVSLANGIYRFQVNEVDVKKPSRPVSATSDTRDAASIINVAKQVSITESNKYVASFPGSLNTARHIYTEELDMFCFMSADVIAENVEIDLEEFGGIKRYRALPANDDFNTGVRMCALVLEQFEDGFDNTVVSQLAPGDTLKGGGNDPESNPWGRPPRSQAELGLRYENTNVATFDPDAVSE